MKYILGKPISAGEKRSFQVVLSMGIVILGVLAVYNAVKILG